jgi:hypothetical protein
MKSMYEIIEVLDRPFFLSKPNKRRKLMCKNLRRKYRIIDIQNKHIYLVQPKYKEVFNKSDKAKAFPDSLCTLLGKEPVCLKIAFRRKHEKCLFK